jgi:hypothetical protein
MELSKNKRMDVIHVIYEIDDSIVLKECCVCGGGNNHPMFAHPKCWTWLSKKGQDELRRRGKKVFDKKRKEWRFKREQFLTKYQIPK